MNSPRGRGRSTRPELVGRAVKQLTKAIMSESACIGFGAWGLRRRMAGRRVAPELGGVRSILIIRLNLMGDLLFTLPSIVALRTAAPHARITMLVLPYTAELVRGSKLADRVLTADVNRWRRPASWVAGNAPKEIRSVVAEMRRDPYDLCISFYGQVGAAFASLGGARYTVGYQEEGYPFSFDLALPGKRYESRRHEAEYCMDLIRALGVSATLEQPVLPDDAAAEAKVERLLAEAGAGSGQRLVAIHPGAFNMAAKRWFASRWAVVADRIQSELGRRVVLAGSASELPLAEAVQREMRTRPVMLAGRTSIPELIALLKRCELFMGGDSGPLHLASALGVPSVSIYGPTDPANSGPLGPKARVLRGSAGCIPCYDLKRPATCWRGDLLCMAQVSSGLVFEAAREMLGANHLEEPKLQPERPGHVLADQSGATGDRAHPGPVPEGEGEPSATPLPNPEPLTDHSSLFRRILVVKLAGIGDLLTAFPALEALRRRYPHAEITALVTPLSASLLHASGLVDRVMEMDKYAFDTVGGFTQLRSVAGLVGLARELRARSFDAVVLLHHLVTATGIAKYALLTLASGARTRAGLDDGRGWFLNLAYPDRGFGAMHEVDYWLAVVGLLDAVNPNPRVRMTWGEEEERFADQAWREMGLAPGDKVVAIHPGTGSYSPARRWYPERFAKVGAALAQDGLVPMVVAGPGEEALARQVADGMASRAAVLSGTPTPRHLAAVLARCRLFVGNDSGVMHVAVAASLPVVAVFGPSNHRAWGPYDPGGSRTRIVRVELPCSPCLYRGHSLGLRNGCGDFQCLGRISPEAVIAAARELLSTEP